MKCIDDKYVIQRKIGESVKAETFVVRHAFNSTVYVLKWFKKSFGNNGMLSSELFGREYESRKILSSYLIHQYGRGEYMLRPYVVLEYCSKDLLTTLCEHTISISKIVLDVLQGLMDLRRQHRYHGNLKIANILLRNDGTCILTDFAEMANSRTTKASEQQLEPYYAKDLHTLGRLVTSLIIDKHPSKDLCAEDVDMMEMYSDIQDNILKWAPEWLQFIRCCLKGNADIGSLFSLVPDNATYKRVYDNAAFASIRRHGYGKGTILRVLDGADYGNVFSLDELRTPQTPTITIGRADETVWNVIQLTDLDVRLISRMHASIVWIEEKRSWKLLDGQKRIACPLGRTLQNTDEACSVCPVTCPSEFKEQQQTYQFVRSLNGVYVNGQRVPDEGVILHNGDEIKIGTAILVVDCVQ